MWKRLRNLKDGLVAASRPAWRVLKVHGAKFHLCCFGGCSVSTRMEGTERYLLMLPPLQLLLLQRLDPHGGY